MPATRGAIRHPVTTRWRTSLAIVLAAAALGSSWAPAAAAPAQPDIIVVMLDDLGAIDERVLRRLPNITKLWLDGGRRYDNAYTETPLCCPGRAAFLTGQHTSEHGVWTNRNGASLLDPTETIATAFSGAGYWTAVVGKYLNGYQYLEDRTPPGWDRLAVTTPMTRYFDPPWYVDGVRRPDLTGYVTTTQKRLTVEALGAAPVDRPWFLWLTPMAPHAGMQSRFPDPAPRHVGDARCAGIDPWLPPSYDFPEYPEGWPLTRICESLLSVDELIGKTRRVVAQSGRDPLWVLTSDNGMAYGAHGWHAKQNPWSVHVPLWIAPGTGVETGLVSNIDLPVILARHAGVPLPFASGTARGRDEMLEDSPTTDWSGIRSLDWHYIRWGDGRRELYDLRSDPWEVTNVADDPAYAEAVADHERRLAAFRS
jgi:N-acetylglucosamine-6-sulfatase